MDFVPQADASIQEQLRAFRTHVSSVLAEGALSESAAMRQWARETHSWLQQFLDLFNEDAVFDQTKLTASFGFWRYKLAEQVLMVTQETTHLA